MRQVRWEDVGGLEAIKQRLQEAVQWPQTHSAALARLGAKVDDHLPDTSIAATQHEPGLYKISIYDVREACTDRSGQKCTPDNNEIY